MMYPRLSGSSAEWRSARSNQRLTRMAARPQRTGPAMAAARANPRHGEAGAERPHRRRRPARRAVANRASRDRVQWNIAGWAQVIDQRGALDSVDKIVHRVNHDRRHIKN